MLPRIVDSFHLSLINSVASDVTKKLKNQSLLLEKSVGSNPFLINGEGKVYCISDEEVQLKDSEDKYKKSAQLFYNELPAEIQALAEKKLKERTAAINSIAVQPYMKLREVKPLSSQLRQLPSSQPHQVAQTPSTSCAVEQSEDTPFMTLKGYFSDITLYNNKLKDNNKALFELMGKDPVNGVACDNAEISNSKASGAREVYKGNLIFHIALPRLLMVTETKVVLEPLITEFRSTNDKKRKEEIATVIGTQCVKYWSQFSSRMRTGKGSYQAAMKEVKAGKAVDANQNMKALVPADSQAVAVSQPGAVATENQKQKMVQALSTVLEHERSTVNLQQGLRDMTLSFTPAFDGRQPDRPAKVASTTSTSFHQLQDLAREIGFEEKSKTADEKKEEILNQLKNTIESKKLVDMVTGDLIIPKVLLRNENDLELFKDYVLDLVCLYREALQKGGKKSSYAGVFLNAVDLEHVTQLFFQIQGLVERK